MKRICENIMLASLALLIGSSVILFVTAMARILYVNWRGGL